MRKGLDIFLAVITGLCALTAVALLIGLVYVIAQKGGPAVSWGFLTEQIRLVGAAGGIFWNLMGTLILITTAFVVFAPLAVGLSLVERVYLRSERSRRLLRTVIYMLNAFPSIVFGLFGFIVFVQWCGMGKSWLAGGLVLALMMLPTVTVSLVERLKAVPNQYVEAAAGLGLKPSQIIRAVLLPQAWGGLITGSLLALARAAGEVAPIMFTATIFAGATWPKGVSESPVLALPYHIFILAQDSFDPEVGDKLWGSALVLLGLVFVLSLIALPSRLKIHEEANV